MNETPMIKDDERSMWDFVDRYDKGLERILSGYLEAKTGQRMVWPVVRAARLKRIALDFHKSGVVRDEKGMGEIRDRLLDNIAMLRASTEMMGHSQDDPVDVAERSGYYLSEQQIEDLAEYLTHHDGSWLLSDYGLPQLEKFYDELYYADTSEQMLFAAFKVLWVVHARSDLASLFVEGGTKTLNEISGEGFALR